MKNHRACCLGKARTNLKSFIFAGLRWIMPSTLPPAQNAAPVQLEVRHTHGQSYCDSKRFRSPGYPVNVAPRTN